MQCRVFTESCDGAEAWQTIQRRLSLGDKILALIPGDQGEGVILGPGKQVSNRVSEQQAVDVWNHMALM